MGNPADRYKRIVKEVCADLKCKPDSELARHVSTLRLMRENMQAKLLVGDRVDPDDLLKLDAALKQWLPEREAPTINIRFVKPRTISKCPHCGKFAEHSDKPFENGRPQVETTRAELEAAARAADAASSAAPAPEPPKPSEPPTIRGFRGVSNSDYHDQVRADGLIAPLKRLQPRIHDKVARNVSPMSSPTNDHAPRRHNAPPQGSAFNDPNPNRKA